MLKQRLVCLCALLLCLWSTASPAQTPEEIAFVIENLPPALEAGPAMARDMRYFQTYYSRMASENILWTQPSINRQTGQPTLSITLDPRDPDPSQITGPTFIFR